MNKSILNISAVTSAALIAGMAIAIFGFPLLNNTSNNEMNANNDNESQPLYWVAPMDANFQRDKPGLSPMGMELVPVYDSMGNNEAGVVVISPAVVNNLGVKIAPVMLGKLQQTIRTTGMVVFDDDNRVNMHSRVEGWIEKLHVNAIGDNVLKGQPLYDIYSPELVNAQEELVLAIEQHNKRLINAATRRLTALAVPKIVIDKIIKTRQVSNTLTINAPIDGVIDHIIIREGTFINPAMNLLTISSLDTVWVNVDVFESQTKQLNVGDKALITSTAYPNKEWTSEVDIIYPMLNENTRTQQFKLRINNSNYMLKPNMYTNILLQPKSLEETLLIPSESVIRTGRNNRVVLALGEGKYKSIKVDIGLSNESHTQILSGLELGDKVVTSAQFLLDSESNISSDLMRYSTSNNTEKVWVQAIVNRVFEDYALINVSHEPIPSWSWPEMTMDFYVDESLSMDSFSVGQTLNIEIMKDSDGDYIITDMKKLSEMLNKPAQMMENNIKNNIKSNIKSGMENNS